MNIKIFALLLCFIYGISGSNIIKSQSSSYIPEVPYFYQYNNHTDVDSSAGVSAMAMILKFYGASTITPDIIMEQNTAYANLNDANSWQTVFNSESLRNSLSLIDEQQTNGKLSDLHTLLAKKIPVAVHGDFIGQKHVVVVVGYDGEYYYVNDPAGSWNQVIKTGVYLTDNSLNGYYTKYKASIFEAAIGGDSKISMHVVSGQINNNVPLEGFEKATIGGIPTGWNRFAHKVTGVATNTNSWVATTETPYAGTKVVKMTHYQSLSDCWLVTPRFSPEKNNDFSVSFFARSTTNDYGSKIEIYISENETQPTDSTGFPSTPVAFFQEESHGDYVEKVLNLKEFAGKKIYLGFKIHNFGDPKDALAGGDNWWIDNVSGLYPLFENNSPIIKNQQFMVNETCSVADVVGTVEFIDFDSDFQTHTFRILSGNESGTFAIDSITGQIFVAKPELIKYKNQSEYNLTVSVSDNYTIPATSRAYISILVGSVYRIEDFETANDNTLPYGWTTFAENGIVADSIAWQCVTEAPYDGFRAVMMEHYNSISDCWLVSPAFEVENQTALRFYARSTIDDYNSSLKVFISVSDTTPTQRNDFFTEPDIIIYEGVDDSYHQYAVDLTKYSGMLIYVGFVVENFTEGDNWWIDNVNFFGHAVVNTPPQIFSQTFSIDENSPSGTSVGIVQATDNEMPQQKLRFTIISGNEKGIFKIENTTGEIRVDNNKLLDYETQSEYVLQIRATDNGEGFFSAEADITISLNDLDETAINDSPTVDALTLYPNPTKGEFYISSKNYNEYEIYNQQGILVSNGILTDINLNKINIKPLANGVYYVLVSNKKTTKSIKLIKYE